ncbi:unnamed protein product [Parascedosporium putredinis]|uniref:Uncharacterized protein n=1 Tax=Parascedosporium putredinis TaxID=1442378 RepID=A0A9P1GV50_9PEZI|nr:unnamed protein product [Parascedosporium putredinis]CAI7987918.1 unnamed protein product [Parascedosporium putredinis]
MRQPRTSHERRAQLAERQIGNFTDSDSNGVNSNTDNNAFTDTDDGFANRNRLPSTRRRRRHGNGFTSNDGGFSTDDGFFGRNRLGSLQRRRVKKLAEKRQIQNFTSDDDNGITSNDGGFSTDDGFFNRNRLPAAQRRRRMKKRAEEKRQIQNFTSDDDNGITSNDGGFSDTDDGFFNRNRPQRRRTKKREEKRQIQNFTSDDDNGITSNDGGFSDTDDGFFNNARQRPGNKRKRRVDAPRRETLEARSGTESDDNDPFTDLDSDDEARNNQPPPPSTTSSYPASPPLHPCPRQTSRPLPRHRKSTPSSTSANPPPKLPLLLHPQRPLRPRPRPRPRLPLKSQHPSAPRGCSCANPEPAATSVSDIVSQITGSADSPSSSSIAPISSGTGAESGQANSPQGITSGESAGGMSRGAAIGIAFGTIASPAGLGRSDSTRTDTVVMDKAMRAIYANELSPEDKLYAGQETLDQRSMRELEADQAVTPIDKPMPVLPLPSDNAGGRGRETMFRQVDGWLQRTTSMFSQPNRNTVFPGAIKTSSGPGILDQLPRQGDRY